MPVLPNARHERFAQELFKGKTADEAYRLAGFRPHRGNASRMSANESILERVAELSENQAKAVTEACAFEAKRMFEDILRDIADAKADGDHKTAASLRMFLIRCFGYEDSPTLTHEHVKGQRIQLERPSGYYDTARPPQDEHGSNVLPLSKAIRDLKRKIGG